MLKGKKILVGITGSIAAYKTITLVRLLIKAGAEVKVVMTNAAREFASPVVLSTLSKNKVINDLVEGDEWSNHVMLGRWADVFVIAPLSCNTMAKMANGLCDNVLLAVYLSATCPVVIAPAMDEDMWHHPSTKRNLDQLEKDGNQVIRVGNGELASGLFGEGRMAEPEEICQYLIEHFFRTEELKGKKAIVTAGPTYEAIDPVRFIGNHSSGKMGFAIAEELYLRGAEVLLIAGPTHQKTNYKGIQVRAVVSGDQMYEVATQEFSDAHIAVMSAAVADYKPVSAATDKIKKKQDAWEIALVKNKDILLQLGKDKKQGQFLMGFALETSNEKENALSKLQSKNADAIVLNSLNDKDAGFGIDTNDVTIFHSNGIEVKTGIKSKKAVATDIVSFIIKHLHA
ncbi:MAG: bifunctional phosphopantothenoylcysteine decarboxylase/phosphopantothenate--cysteine ligase CoaBC [Sediminibacterium sp.]|uniref:bifunctional phosphopantothenoylcysteine decarboxylase/phosphopantothenate--cysteine ligase CoaBC n=1 Tax=Sediminibacterium sp. TaxID=1917865 RepID=UPI002ABB0A33|nr:bifunctional phosphopantothenoylcysteine decarboxylase/phosphopantothenate--cysteine ligase CoaBC [Sediminibacterium sp.]MDZ4071163.1 bifunctional phosphopantothenoylcysteine decarboxylase/phosphopantothenate--cysteine ligase CoaBC [Sediminibacterium sp.]